MILALQDTSIILILIGFVQFIFLGLGGWVLLELHRLNATISRIDEVLRQLQSGHKAFYEFRREIEPKVDTLWSERAEKRRSVPDMPSVGGGNG